MKRLCFLLLTAWLLSLPARADGIPIVGNAEASSQLLQEFFDITSPTTLFQVNMFFEAGMGGFSCLSGTVCDLTVTIPAFIEGRNIFQNFTWIDGTTGTHQTFNGPVTGFVTGDLVFPNPGFVFSFPPDTHFSLTGTIPFSGQLSGFLGDLNDVERQVFSVDLSGTATFDFVGRESPDGTFALVDPTDFNFAGTATPVPEPSSLLLLGSGLMFFARWKRAGRGI
jgi:hypothetical protein